LQGVGRLLEGGVRPLDVGGDLVGNVVGEGVRGLAFPDSLVEAVQFLGGGAQLTGEPADGARQILGAVRVTGRRVEAEGG
jgi:hypothetical protein